MICVVPDSFFGRRVSWFHGVVFVRFLGLFCFCLIYENKIKRALKRCRSFLLYVFHVPTKQCCMFLLLCFEDLIKLLR